MLCGTFREPSGRPLGGVPSPHSDNNDYDKSHHSQPARPIGVRATLGVNANLLQGSCHKPGKLYSTRLPHELPHAQASLEQAAVLLSATLAQLLGA